MDVSTPTDFEDYVELAVREEPGITVRLLWDRPRDRVWLSYEDLGEEAGFATPVASERAWEAFQHPNTFRPAARRTRRRELDPR